MRAMTSRMSNGCAQICGDDAKEILGVVHRRDRTQRLARVPACAS